MAIKPTSIAGALLSPTGGGGPHGNWQFLSEDGQFIVGPSAQIPSAASATLDAYLLVGTTVLFTGNTNVSTAAGANYASFKQPTYTGGGALTVTSAATVAIQGAPIAGTNVTITNAYSLWVQGGTARFDGNVSFTGGQTLTGGPVTFTPTESVASGAGATLDDFTIASTTVTITGNTSISTAAGFNFASIKQPTYSAASALTVTSAATLALQGAPIAGGAGPVTITNAYTLWAQAGASRFDGPLVMNGPAGAVGSATTLVKTIATLVDNTATTLAVITITNAIAGAMIEVSVIGTSGDGDSSQAVIYNISIARIAGAATVSAISAATGAGTATGANAVATTVTLQGLAGANGATQTLNIQVKVAHTGGGGGPHSATAQFTTICALGSVTVA